MTRMWLLSLILLNLVNWPAAYGDAILPLRVRQDFMGALKQVDGFKAHIAGKLPADWSPTVSLGVCNPNGNIVLYTPDVQAKSCDLSLMNSSEWAYCLILEFIDVNQDLGRLYKLLNENPRPFSSRRGGGHMAPTRLPNFRGYYVRLQPI